MMLTTISIRPGEFCNLLIMQRIMPKSKQCLNCESGVRVDDITGNLSQRCEHKEPFTQTRVRQDELTGRDTKIIKEQEIQIEGAVLVALQARVTVSSVEGFNRVELLKKIEGRASGADHRRGIDKPVGADHAHRFAAIRRGEGHGKNTVNAG